MGANGNEIIIDAGEVEIEATENTPQTQVMDMTKANFSSNLLRQPVSSTVTTKQDSSSNTLFRSKLTPNELTVVNTEAKEIAGRVVDNPNFIVDFRQETMRQLSALSERLIKEQQEITIPEVDKILNDILNSINDYKDDNSISSKVAKKVAKKTRKGMLKRLFKSNKFRNDLEAAVRLAKPIEEKIREAESDIERMQDDVKTSVVRSQTMREETLKALRDIVYTLAYLEATKEELDKKIQELTSIRDNAGDQQFGTVDYNGNKYTKEEFEVELNKHTKALSDVNVSIVNWEQKFFIYYNNISLINNLIAQSADLYRQCGIVRTDGLQLARTQIVQLQQAKGSQEIAEKTLAISESLNELIVSSAVQTTEAVKATAEATTVPLIKNETLAAIVNELEKQSQILQDKGMTMQQTLDQAHNFLTDSLTQFQKYSTEQRTRLINNAMSNYDNETKTKPALLDNNPTRHTTQKPLGQLHA